jgi:hypothetical protein
MKIKPAVKLDLGEMCKLRLLFFVSREICIPFSFVANSILISLAVYKFPSGSANYSHFSAEIPCEM